jgi:benzoyl-CoA reductase/2-hydroxyglutaryl-CoA dehydratase subunit BcrC/BadD/HgdB
VATAFETMQKHYQQRGLDAQEWKKKGGKVVGYFCDSVPEELILAAGFFPLRLSGDPKGSTDVARKHVIARFVMREDFVHSMFNMLLTGRYDYLDFLVIPHARDSIHRLYQLLAAMKKSDPSLKIPELHFFDILHTTLFSSEPYEHDQMLELKGKLEEWSGKKITNTALSQAIAITNENKVLLKKVASLRAAEPPRISGVEAIQIIGSSMFMLKEEHNRLLRQYLEGASKFPARDGARLFVGGSPLDNLQLYEIIESNKATVVADDNCWGNRYSDVPIDTSLDPFEAIVDRYHNKSPCPRMYPLSRLIEYSLQSAVGAKAQAAICYVFENDAAESWATADKIKALEGKGIPTLALKEQKYLISDPEPLKTSINKLIPAV